MEIGKITAGILLGIIALNANASGSSTANLKYEVMVRQADQIMNSIDVNYDTPEALEHKKNLVREILKQIENKSALEGVHWTEIQM
jgi:hypothetical protein